MRLTLSLLTGICILFISTSCSNQHSSEGMVVTLNDGKKWDANPETTTGISNMQQIMSGVQDGNLDLQTRKAVKEDLEEEFQTIFKKCTMTGEAHNQLHNYLLPLKAIMKDIDSKDASIGNQKVGELRVHLDTYADYFQ